RTQANLVLLLAGALWGMGFVAQSTAMEAIGPYMFSALRFIVATLAVLPLALFASTRSARPLQRIDWLAFIWIGIILFGAITTQQVGLLTTTVTNSGFLTGLYVVLTPFFAVLLFRVWPHPAVWPGAALALAGIWFLSGGAIDNLA